ncbi:MAG: cation:proton antiporter [Acidobacteriota bacterium]
MESLHLLRDLLVIYGIGVAVVFVFQKLRQSAIVGYLVTGVLVGPRGFEWVSSSVEVEALAEIGVMLLLFSLGLEFSLQKLAKMSRVVIGTGSAQVIVCVALTVLLVGPLGIGWPQSLFWGFVMSLSSTAIVLKFLLERAEMDSVQGRVSLGILIFQDLCVVPMMVTLPVLSSSGDLLMPLIGALGKASLVVAGTLIGARYLFPHILNWMVSTRNKELFIISSMFLFFGTAWVISWFGLSLALGAFIAGLVLSESEYSHQIFADIRPFRDSLNSLFFISVGMLVDPGFVLSQIRLIGLLIVLVILGKSILVGGAVFFSKYPVRIAIIVGLGLAQVGEFSFILLKEGLKHSLVSDFWYQVLLSTSVATMILTPIAFTFSFQLAEKASLQRWIRRLQWRQGLPDIAEETSRLKDHLVICGYGTNGRNIARVLRRNGVPYVILEVNADTVRRERERGETIFFGDCTNPEVLTHAGIQSARAVVLAISDPFSVRTATRLARSLNPEGFIIIRTKYLADVDDLYDLGASEVVTEEFETSIEILTRILRIYRFPRNVIRDEVKQIRDERYEMFRDLHLPAQPDQGFGEFVRGQTENFKVTESSPALGKDIRTLGLRARTGASIVGVLRQGESFANPSAEFVIRADDTLVLLGSTQELENAVHYLEKEGLSDAGSSQARKTDS